jgi:hypothetical protein
MLSEGTIIDDKYETLSAPGVGGFGAVYKCTQKTLNTTLLQESVGAPGIRDRKKQNAT